jgi:hypothetical protein
MILQNVWGTAYVKELHYLKVYAYRTGTNLMTTMGSSCQATQLWATAFRPPRADRTRTDLGSTDGSFFLGARHHVLFWGLNAGEGRWRAVGRAVLAIIGRRSHLIPCTTSETASRVSVPPAMARRPTSRSPWEAPTPEVGGRCCELQEALCAQAQWVRGPGPMSVMAASATPPSGQRRSRRAALSLTRQGRYADPKKPSRTVIREVA